MTSIGGVIPIMPTPFDDSGNVDVDSLRRLTDYLVASGVHGLAACGVASEGYALTDDERDVIVSTVVRQVDGRVPVLAGCGHHSREAGSQMARRAEEAGANALFVMPPYFVKPTEEAIFEYFAAIDAAVSVPVMVQDNPQWTSVPLSLEMLRRLSELPNVNSIKVEVPHPPTKMRQLRGSVGDALALFGGLAGNWLPEELASGSSGTMPAAIMPSVYVEVWDAWQRGAQAEARALFHRYHPAIRVTAQQSVGFAMVKWLMWKVGVIATPHVRSPLHSLSAADERDLVVVCEELNLFETMRIPGRSH
jgi:2-keto-3-deoxy-L-arabinonate dehydratase